MEGGIFTAEEKKETRFDAIILCPCILRDTHTHTHTQIQTAGTDARRTRMPTKESLAPYKNGFIQLPVYFGKLVSFLQNPTCLGEGGEREKCGYMLV